jgi:hypothetical protein
LGRGRGAKRWRNLRLQPTPAFWSFPPVHRVDREGQLRVQAVRKLLRVFTRTYFVRFFEPSERSEARKSRRISLCSASRRKSPCFRTASVELTSSPRRRQWPVFALTGRPESTSSGCCVAFPMIPTMLAGTERHSSDHQKQCAGARAPSNPFLRERCCPPPCLATRLHGPLRRRFARRIRSSHSPAIASQTTEGGRACLRRS